MWKKEKMLVTSIFSFSYNVFKSPLFQSLLKSGLCRKELKEKMQKKVIFSSPEHKVLRVSYCDSAMSDVCCASSCVNFLPCVCSRGYICRPIIMKMVRMFVLMKSRTSFKMGHARSETRSLGQMLKNLVYTIEATFSI